MVYFSKSKQYSIKKSTFCMSCRKFSRRQSRRSDGLIFQNRAFIEITLFTCSPEKNQLNKTTWLFEHFITTSLAYVSNQSTINYSIKL